MRDTWAFLALLACILVILVAMCSAVELLELHGPDGQLVFVNAAEISSLRAPTASDLARHFPAGTRCLVVTTNGKFFATAETCTAIRDQMR